MVRFTDLARVDFISGSNISIVNNIPAFADVLKSIIPPATAPATPASTTSAPMTLRSPLVPRSNVLLTPCPKPTHMTMIAFCEAFKLSDTTTAALSMLELDGPHLLPHLSDPDLDRWMTVGQHAAMRYAQSLWMKGYVSL
ncbi:unnamed protein product [Mycena citricolor]|uniref:Uncharacterized protein n=1 Tax=Mycena citricolor TaxID=2018698 RepID=A0AAD2GV43_9AGAR|nr:unnamed protein product [Mycena citricolor]